MRLNSKGAFKKIRLPLLFAILVALMIVIILIRDCPLPYFINFAGFASRNTRTKIMVNHIKKAKIIINLLAFIILTIVIASLK
jgi:hypothetical protein